MRCRVQTGTDLSAGVSISTSLFQFNTAEYGGGIFIDRFLYSEKGLALIVSINECTFDRNIASRGGAMALSSQTRQWTTNIINSHFIGNNASYGGGIYLDLEDRVSVNGGTWELNWGAVGGAVFMTGRSRLNVTFVKFLNNTSTNGGAIVAHQGASLHSEHCQFIHNNANATSGGAIQMTDTTHFRDFASEFIANTAYSTGGAVDCSNIAELIFINSHLISNRANAGGAVRVGCVNLTVVNAQFTGNM